MCVCVCSFMCVHAHTCLCRPEVRSGVFFNCFVSHFLRKNPSLKWEPTDWARMADQQATGSSCLWFPRPGITCAPLYKVLSQCLVELWQAWTLYRDQISFDSQWSTYIYLLSTGVKGLYHHAQLHLAFFTWVPEISTQVFLLFTKHFTHWPRARYEFLALPVKAKAC